MQRSGATPIPSPQHNRTNDAIRALSRNITSLLENLLKNYDSNHHPGYDSGFISNFLNFSTWIPPVVICIFVIGLPTIVKSNILVRSMGPFSEHRMVKLLNVYASAHGLITFFVSDVTNHLMVSRLQDYSMDCYFRQVGHFVYLLPTGLTMEFEKRKLLYRAVVAR